MSKFTSMPLKSLIAAFPEKFPADITHLIYTYVHACAFPQGRRAVFALPNRSECVQVHGDIITYVYRYNDAPIRIIARISDCVVLYKYYGENQTSVRFLSGIPGAILFTNNRDTFPNSFDVTFISTVGCYIGLIPESCTMDLLRTMPEDKYFIDMYTNKLYVIVPMVVRGSSITMRLYVLNHVVKWNMFPNLIHPNTLYGMDDTAGGAYVFWNPLTEECPSSCDWMKAMHHVYACIKVAYAKYTSSISDIINGVVFDGEIQYNIIPHVNGFLLIGRSIDYMDKRKYIRMQNGEYIENNLFEGLLPTDYIGDSDYGPCTRIGNRIYVWCY